MNDSTNSTGALPPVDAAAAPPGGDECAPSARPTVGARSVSPDFFPPNWFGLIAGDREFYEMEMQRLARKTL